MKYKRISDKYYWYNQHKGEYLETEGEAIALKGYPEIEAFIHKNDNSEYVLTECLTGKALSNISEGVSKTSAVKSAIDNLNKWFGDNGKWDQLIEGVIKKYGISPRYEGGKVESGIWKSENCNKFHLLKQKLKLRGVNIFPDKIGFMTGKFKVDIMTLENLIPNYDSERCEYKGNPNYSMSMAIEEEWGEDIAKLIKELI